MIAPKGTPYVYSNFNDAKEDYRAAKCQTLCRKVKQLS